MRLAHRVLYCWGHRHAIQRSGINPAKLDCSGSWSNFRDFTRFMSTHRLVPPLCRWIHTEARIIFTKLQNGAAVQLKRPVRVARARNRIVSMLRFAKNIPFNRPVIHPITHEFMPLTRATCHSCGRQFHHRPQGKDFEPNPDRKYCHHTCQNSRPKKFDLWLEEKIMQALKEIHGIEKDQDQLKFGVVLVSTESIEDYVMKHRDGVFGSAIPRHLTERIRQAARRLVGIPGRGGDIWQAIALEEIPNEENEGENKWVRRRYAPDRGQFMLGLMRKDTENMPITEFSSEEQRLRKINGVLLKEPPEWGERWWWDDAGKIRPATDTRRAQRALTVPHEDALDTYILLNAQRAEKQRARQRQQSKKSKGWSALLSENQETIEALTAQRMKELGL